MKSVSYNNVVRILARLSFAIAVLLLVTPIICMAQTTTQWLPKAGKLILGGGNISDETSKEFAKRLITLAGGPDALIVIIPTANPRADTAELVHWLKSAGANNVAVLNTKSREVANSDSFVKVLRLAKAVFMTGGQPLLLENTYRGTLVEKELKALLARGGVISGDSAGAIAIGCIWLTWLPDHFGKRTDEFCILPAVAVGPHSSNAKGYVPDDEVLKYLNAHPGVTGIDIDEDTMLILDMSGAEVIGGGKVSILDATINKTKPVLILKAGGHYPL
jgi:cyanophycinase